MSRTEGRGQLRAVATLLLSRVFVVALASAAGILAFNPAVSGEWNIPVPLLSGFARWDAGYYLDISKFGYPGLLAVAANPHEILFYSFRPLYPAAIYALRPLFGWLDVDEAGVLAGFLWNLIMLALTGVYLWKLTNALFGARVAGRTVLLLAFFPTSYVLSAIYPDATFLFLSVACLYYMETGNEAVAAILGFLTGLTRPEGFLLAIPFLVKAYQGGRRRRLVASAVSVMSSLPLFLAFSYYNMGDALAPLTVEMNWQKNTLLGPPNLPPPTVGNLLPILVNVAVFVVAASFFLLSILRRPTGSQLPYYAWTAVVIVVFLLDADIRSWARLTMLAFPLLWTQAGYTLGRPRLRHLLLGAYVLLLCAATVMFADWYQML
ncbi:MAG: glycosyltransferase family 39 protein [Nitrososphaerota archaeon]|nr:glycosyltransferase family 39 protein [Nitrososphaerota archaeon]